MNDNIINLYNDGVEIDIVEQLVESLEEHADTAKGVVGVVIKNDGALDFFYSGNNKLELLGSLEIVSQLIKDAMLFSDDE